MYSLEARRVSLYDEITENLPKARTIAAVTALGNSIAASIDERIGPALNNLPHTLMTGGNLLEGIRNGDVGSQQAQLILESRLRILVNTRVMEYEEESRMATLT